MNHLIPLAALLGGLVIGAGARVMTRAEPEPPARPPAEVVTTEVVRTVLVPAPSCAEETELMASIAALGERLDTVETEVAVALAQSEVEIGPPGEWPTDVDPAYTEVGVEAAVHAILDELGTGTLVGLDCGEFPCVGIVAFTTEDMFDQQEPMRQGLKDHGYASIRSGSSLRTDDDGSAALLSLVIAFQPEPAEGADLRRLSYRLEEAASTFAPELRDLMGEAR